MTIGKKLWTVILIKLIIIFVFIRLFLMPNFLQTHADKGHEADYVANDVIQRSIHATRSPSP